MKIHAMQIIFEKSGAVTRKTIELIDADQFDPFKYVSVNRFAALFFAPEGQFPVETAAISQDELEAMIKGCNDILAGVERIEP